MPNPILGDHLIQEVARRNAHSGKVFSLFCLLTGLACVVLWSQVSGGAVSDPAIATVWMPTQRMAGIGPKTPMRARYFMQPARAEEPKGVIRSEEDAEKYMSGEWAPKPAEKSSSGLGSTAEALKAAKAARQAAWVDPERKGDPEYTPPKAANPLGQQGAAMKAEKEAVQSTWVDPERTGKAPPPITYESPKPAAGGSADLGSKADAIKADKEALQSDWVVPERTGELFEPKPAVRDPKYQPPQPADLGSKAAAIKEKKEALQSEWVVPERKNKLTGHLATVPFGGKPRSEAAEWIADWRAKQ